MIVTSSAERKRAVQRLNIMTMIRNLENSSARDSDRLRSGLPSEAGDSSAVAASATVSAPFGELVVGESRLGEEVTSVLKEDAELVERPC